jgi:hypothetical protein
LALDNEAAREGRVADMRGWSDLSEQEKEKIDREMCAKSQENMLLFYRNEIKGFLSGEPLPKRIARALYGNGIVLRNGKGKFGSKYRIDAVVLKNIGN